MKIWILLTIIQIHTSSKHYGVYRRIHTSTKSHIYRKSHENWNSSNLISVYNREFQSYKNINNNSNLIC